MNLITIWIILGIILLIAEMLTGTFVLIFIALGCFVAALSILLLPQAVTASIIVCAVISLVGAFLLRKPLQKKLLMSADVQNDIGQVLLMDQTILSHQQVRIAYQGTTWQATNVGAEGIQRGDRVTIVGLDNTVLLLRKN